MSDRDIVLNDPVNLIDPEGESILIPVLFGIGLIIDIIINIEFEEGDCPENFSINIDPPIMWDNGIPLPFLLGVQIDAEIKDTPLGEVGVPTEINITGSPVLEPLLQPPSGPIGPI